MYNIKINYIVINSEAYSLIYILLLFIVCLTYIALIFSNPGLLKTFSYENKSLLRLAEEKANLIDFCETCLIKKTTRSKHCIICDRCTEGFDHHCYWINNCIGNGNIYIFLFFILMLNINLLYNFITCLISKYLF